MSPPAVRVNDLAWMIGGPQGSGVDSSANVFARACAAGGLHIFGKRELYSHIMGEHSYFALLADSKRVRPHLHYVNMLAVGASFGILGFDFEMMRRSLEDVFRAKAKVVNMNAAGARKAYDIAKALVPEFPYRLEKLPRKESRLFLTGSQATALGKLYGGMRFQTYYPITPAPDESEFLEENEILDLNGHGLAPDAAGAAVAKEEGASMLVVQTEDEIAAITMATGAALTGARSATP